ncbi:MAG TPA: C4-type zinc ribbon domain-containing protein [Chthonomonadaceae bacterium]|nr:C4-type zinc ribbon domain-containing protein [Chthonomonadaceae bacterium]
MKEKLAALLALQQQDSAIDSLKKQYAKLDTGKAEAAAAEAAKAAAAEADASEHAARASVVDTELERKSVEERRVEYENRLYSGKITNAKELQAMQSEVDMLARHRDSLDAKLKSALEELEECRERHQAANASLAGAAAAAKRARAEYKSSSDNIVAQARLLVAQRAEAAKQIEPKLLAQYEAIRKDKAGLAVVPVEDANSCGGCKMGIASSVIKRLQAATGVERCDNCGRVLVLVA